MKSFSKRTGAQWIFVALVILFVFSTTQNAILTKAALFNINDRHIYSTKFIDAKYLDADQDSNADDTRFLVEFRFSMEVFCFKTSKINCNFTIILPSGIEYKYTGFIILNCAHIVIIQFDVLNTVSESGWYTINFYSTTQVKNTLYVSFCTIDFDPPTGLGEGGGTPTIEF